MDVPGFITSALRGVPGIERGTVVLGLTLAVGRPESLRCERRSRDWHTSAV